MAASCGSTFLTNSLGICTHVQSLHEKGDARQMYYGFSYRSLPRLYNGKSSRKNWGLLSASGRIKFWSPNPVKASNATLAAASERVASESDSHNGNQNGSFFPEGFESLIMEVCDETDVAEIKLKAGNFEMHMRRNIDISKGPSCATSPLTPHITSDTTVVSDPVDSSPAPSSKPPKALPTGSSNPFTSKPAKATSDDGMFIVTSPKVGVFKKNRVAKGRVGPVVCEVGKTIKEGQVVGYLEHLSSQLPIMSTVAGEIVSIIPNDGAPVGFDDPLIVILPSFHGIQ